MKACVGLGKEIIIADDTRDLDHYSFCLPGGVLFFFFFEIITFIVLSWLNDISMHGVLFLI